MLIEELASLDEGSEKTRKRLKLEGLQVEQERRVWAEKSIAGVIPDDIASEKQKALGKRLAHLREELGRLALDAAEVRLGIDQVMDLATACDLSYERSEPQVRRQWNQAWFQWIEVDVDEDGEAQVSAVVRTRLTEAIKNGKVRPGGTRPTDSRGHRQRRPSAFSCSHGLRVRTLVGARGLEPPTSAV